MRGTGGGVRRTHINSNMAHHTLMVRESYILTLIMHTIGIRTLGSGLIIDNKSALDVNLDSAGIGDRVQPAGTCVGGLNGMRVRNSRIVEEGSHNYDLVWLRFKRVEESQAI